MSTTKKNANALGILGIMMVFFFSQGVTAIYPIQELLTQVFPTVSQPAMTYASTIVTITCLVSLVVLGSIVGRKISYKATAVLGFVLYGVGGALPFFFPSFPMIMVGRAILGLGTGSLQMLGAPLLAGMIEYDEKRSTWAGIGSTVCYLGSCAMALVSGLVAATSWKLSFLIHIVALVGIFTVLLGMKEPDFSSEESEEDGGKKEGFFATAKKIPAVIWVMLICNGLIAMLCMQIDLSSSYVLADMGASQQTIAVSVSLAYVGYASGGLLYIPLNKLLKKFTLAGGAFIALFGMLGCYVAKSPVPFIICSMISCAGYTMGFTSVMYDITVVSDKSAVALMNTFLMFAMSFCAFFSSPFYGFAIGVTGDPIKGQFLPAMICLAVIAVILCFARADKVKTQK